MKSILIGFIGMSLVLSCNSNPEHENKQDDSTSTAPIVEHKPESTTLLHVGQQVPDFTLTTIDGKSVQLSKLKGKTVFLNFFTLSCPMCMKELPVIEKEIWEQYKNNENIVILTVGREEPVDKLIDFHKKKKFSIPMAFDPERKVYALFAEKYVPRNIVINTEGKIVLTEVGFTDETAEQTIAMIKNAIEGK
jgi:peroxiredoxin